MKFETLNFKENEGIGQLEINRPEALNALNEQVFEELGLLLNVVDRSHSLRILIITGSGEKAFVAGADIKEISAMNESSQAQAFAEKGQKIFRRLEVLNKPVIAAVDGFALGGGLELALACDFVYASEKAKFGLPEVGLGIIPGYGGTVRLAKAVGPNKAREMIYSGQIVGAEEALRIGLVNKVCPPEELLSCCMETATQIIAKGPLAVGKAKQVVNRALDMEIDEALMLERQAFSELFDTEDQKEGTKAFIEKRKPEFKGM